MNNFSQLNEYISSDIEANRNLKHSLYPIPQNEVEEAEKRLGIDLPKELKLFYKEVGYGFFHNVDKYHFNRLLDPLSVAQINLKEDFYEFDPDLEYYDYRSENRILFLEICEGNYLTIDINSVHDKNAIYYFDKKINDSLEDFIRNFDNDPDLITKIEF